jgi:hypothetical protein
LTVLVLVDFALGAIRVFAVGFLKVLFARVFFALVTR